MPPRIDDFDPNLLAQKDEEIDATLLAQRLNAANRGTATAQKKDTVDNEVHLPIVWRNVAIFTLLHIGALYGVYLCFQAKWPTLIFAFVLYICGGLGITAGAHRLWAHRTYKAKLPMRLLLALFQTLAVQVKDSFFL